MLGKSHELTVLHADQILAMGKKHRSNDYSVDSKQATDTRVHSANIFCPSLNNIQVKKEYMAHYEKAKPKDGDVYVYL